jgi:hypothetical protein
MNLNLIRLRQLSFYAFILNQPACCKADCIRQEFLQIPSGLAACGAGAACPAAARKQQGFQPAAAWRTPGSQPFGKPMGLPMSPQRDTL